MALLHWGIIVYILMYLLFNGVTGTFSHLGTLFSSSASFYCNIILILWFLRRYEPHNKKVRSFTMVIILSDEMNPCTS